MSKDELNSTNRTILELKFENNNMLRVMRTPPIAPYWN
ncbi:hypothetical protein NC99_30420 [Sunxiuqinia dokdonensis]|uniref:Uncharacterized protein n=1 Tax=Sunxiuqinia dokdonensis TaxID=1409788 RepID=A0A0L8V6I0_9BACT|nr:hypothetical protein NC99_30420 [Sunxiuqinia dokdonensis]